MTSVSNGFVPFRAYRTWYRIAGELGGGMPLVTLHGGPGATHDYLLSLDGLAGDGRAVVYYDQLGCGRSTRLRDADPDFWTVELFLEELDTLLNQLGISDSYDLLGQSWGGMLAAEHAVRAPAGLRKLVIANSPASMHDWSAAAAKLRAELPADVRDALDRYEAAEDYEHPEYKAATQVFYSRHLCRLDPMPAEVLRSLQALEEDSTVYNAMNGPTEFHVIGSLKDWTVIDRLPAIRVPTLVLNGRYDEATDDCVRPFAEGIPGARHVRFENSSHMPHVEEHDSYLTSVRAFLEET